MKYTIEYTIGFTDIGSPADVGTRTQCKTLASARRTAKQIERNALRMRGIVLLGLIIIRN
jgi:hypothetical protein